jgi:hypothetical protein
MGDLIIQFDGGRTEHLELTMSTLSQMTIVTRFTFDCFSEKVLVVIRLNDHHSKHSIALILSAAEVLFLLRTHFVVFYRASKWKIKHIGFKINFFSLENTESEHENR